MQITLNQSLPRALSLLRAPSCGVEARDGPVWGSSSLLGSLWQGHGNIWDLLGWGESPGKAHVPADGDGR